MALDVLQVEYFNITVGDDISEASQLISSIVEAGADFHAFKSVHVEQGKTQFTFFAKDSSKITDGAKKANLKLDGPYPAVLIKGDEKAGALGSIYKKLSLAGIKVNEACGIADINAGYGVVLYLGQEDCDKVISALK